MGGIQIVSALLGDPMLSQTQPWTSISRTTRITDLVMFTSFTMTEVLGLSTSGPIRQPRFQTLRSAERVCRVVGRRYKVTRLSQKRAALAARCWRGKSATWFGGDSGSLADYFAHGDKYRKNSRLQQQAQAGNAKNETPAEQRQEHRDKKTGAAPHGRGSFKINLPNSHPSNPFTRRQ